MMRTTTWTACLLMLLTTLGPITAIAQETEPPICRTTDGRRFATDEQVRKCLKDEKTAQRVNDAVAASEAATAKANAEAGRRAELASLLVKERAMSDGRLVTNTLLEERVAELEERPHLVWGVVVGVVVGVAGTIVALLVAR